MVRKPQPPGQHGSLRRRRSSEYQNQLREKQKAKRIYGILEKQFRKYIEESMGAKEKTAGDTLMQILESRLDNLVYRSGFAVSRAQARQFVRRGLFLVNNKGVNIPSQRLKPKDIIKPTSFEKLHLREGFVLPEWLKANVKEKYVEIVRLPGSEDLQEQIDVQSIIEFYSR